VIAVYEAGERGVPVQGGGRTETVQEDQSRGAGRTLTFVDEGRPDTRKGYVASPAKKRWTGTKRGFPSGILRVGDCVDGRHANTIA
jgi:hypothetical protein